MPGLIARYARWLHTRWPAGTVEPLPEIREGGSTSVPGVYVSGDLTGIPLLKFSLDTGAKVVQRIARDPSLRAAPPSTGLHDLVIIGAGVSGMAAAIEAKKQNLSFAILEAAEPFFTIVNFPKAKPIYTYPKAMTPAGDFQISADVKEALLDELRRQTEAAGVLPIPGRAERLERVGGEIKVHVAGGSRSGRGGSSSRSDRAETSECSGFPARIETMSTTGSTTPTISRGRRLSSWGAATRRSKPPSR